MRKPARDIQCEPVRSVVPAERRHLGIPDFLEVFDLWDKMRGERPAPSWPEIDLINLPLTRLPYCVVVDVSSDPQDFVYRFWGSRITDLHQHDLTGKSVRQINPQDVGETLFLQYARSAQARTPALFVNHVTSGYGLLTEEVILRLPLSSDNIRIDHFICIFDFNLNARVYEKFLDQIDANN